jgi:hypothetical protein
MFSLYSSKSTIKNAQFKSFPSHKEASSVSDRIKLWVGAEVAIAFPLNPESRYIRQQSKYLVNEPREVPQNCHLNEKAEEDQREAKEAAA